MSAAEAAPHPWIEEVAWPADGPPWLAMGLGRIAERDWLLPDADRERDLALRARLLADRYDEVVGDVGGTEVAAQEVLDAVLGWERAHRPDLAAEPADLEGGPLEAAARRVQEDLVIMGRHPDSHHLDAAVLCFPSHWRLRAKLGGSTTAIHGPVPGYREELASKVDRFLDRLRPDVLVARRNWSVHDSDALFSPDPPVDPVPCSVDDVAEGLWLRSERQTLRVLPRSGSVLFTIRVQQASFAAFAHHRAAAARLARRLAVQPEALTEMNGLAPHRDAVLAWLQRVATA